MVTRSDAVGGAAGSGNVGHPIGSDSGPAGGRDDDPGGAREVRPDAAASDRSY